MWTVEKITRFSFIKQLMLLLAIDNYIPTKRGNLWKAAGFQYINSNWSTESMTRKLTKTGRTYYVAVFALCYSSGWQNRKPLPKNRLFLLDQRSFSSSDTQTCSCIVSVLKYFFFTQLIDFGHSQIFIRFISTGIEFNKKMSSI